MHELSVAQEILNIVHQYIPNPEPGAVRAVRVKIGRMSNVLPDSLSFCYDALVSKTSLEGSKLELIQLPLKIICESCGKQSEIYEPVFACPVCENYHVKIISGTELQVEEIVLND